MAELVTTGSSGGAVSGSYRNQNATDIRWGTRSLFGSYVIESIESSTDGENIPITNNDGVKTGRVQLMHGWNYRVTVRDSTALTPPQFGDRVSLYDHGLLVPGNTNPALVVVCRVLETGYHADPRNYGRRTYTVEKLNAFVEPA